ncbi:hypothetical protein SAMN06296065_101230 [Novosphingobium panipatense]|uniref:Chorismate lyase n=2 Tax=Novosphingobium panipatense TaxID=428991 RepID=A0ABY1PXJ2_9SPHN|nr:hypothetical protein SAMN06296065_101230 [Novosphingobium panipatense]
MVTPMIPAAMPAAAPPFAPATLEEFEAVLRRHDSATLALEEWCARRGLGHPPRITAETLSQQEGEVDPELRARLALNEGEGVTQRNVHLRCGPLVLSVAWNWYVSERLTAPMNEALRSSDVPFGKVVAALDFRRRPLSVTAGPARGCPAGTISTHQAILVLPDGRPLAYLVECYTATNLRPPPR